MPNLGFPELVLILFIGLLLFGAGRIPEIARAMGSAVSEFKKAMAGGPDDAPKPRKRRKS